MFLTGPAAADDGGRQRRGRPSGSDASLDSLDEEESDADADVASTSKRRAAGTAGTAAAEPTAAAGLSGAAAGSTASSSSGGSAGSSPAGTRYVYGGMLPSTEALNREAAEGERR